MSPERWQQIKKVLEEALAVAPASRYDFLEKSCVGDEDLRREVESLLVFDNTQTDILENNLFADAIEEIFNDPGVVFLNKLIGGKYEIVSELGAGGMGSVFLAERTDGEFDQRVAVKFLRQGFLSQSARHRFLRERQILARLHHRFIAGLIDGGTTEDGTPYLVMEYVEGTPITRFVRENNLSVRETIELFRNVCQAVSFAHQNLIVHRDLKPDNILITADGTPKLLDFGIAKLLSDTEIKATVTRQQALTPEYASPEQILGQPITTATDVYSLGVILYELLSGAHPYRREKMSAQQIWHSITQNEPVRPSAVSSRFKAENSKPNNAAEDLPAFSEERKTKTKDYKINPKSKIQNLKSLKGDLDNVILKALKKEPSRRYASVEQFSEDLRLYLKGFPVSARSDTLFYRSRKFFSRNPLASAASLVAIVSLIAGFFIAGNEARIARLERQRAERRAENLRKLSSSLIVEIHDEIRKLPGSLPARELILRRAVEQLDALAQETADDDPRLLDELAKGYRNVGEMYQALGNVAAAEKNHRQSNAIYENLAAQNPTNGEYRRQLATGYGFLGDMFYLRGDLRAYSDFYAKAVAIHEKAAAENPQNIDFQKDLWEAYHNQVHGLYLSGRNDEALTNSRKCLQIAEQILQTEGETLDNLHRFYISRGLGSIVLNMLGDNQTAIANLTEISAATEDLIARNPFDTRLKYDAWAFLRRLGIIQKEQGNLPQARANLKKSLDYMENLRNSSPLDAGYRRNASFTLIPLAEIHLSANEFSRALELLEKARQTSEDLYDKDPENGETIGDLALIYNRLGTALIKLGKEEKGLEWQEKSLEFFRRVMEKSPQNVINKTEYIEAAANAAIYHRQMKSAAQMQKAAELAAEAKQMWREMKENQTSIPAESEKIEKLLAEI